MGKAEQGASRYPAPPRSAAPLANSSPGKLEEVSTLLKNHVAGASSKPAPGLPQQQESRRLCHRHRVQQLPAGCAAPCAPLAGLSPEERLGAASETKQSAGEGVEPLTNPAVSLRTSPLTARPCFCWQLGRMQRWEWLCSELAGMSTVHFFKRQFCYQM